MQALMGFCCFIDLDNTNYSGRTGTLQSMISRE